MKQKIFAALVALAIVAFFIFGLSSCSDNAGKQYNTLNKAKWTQTTIDVHWVSKDDISSLCQNLGTNDGGPAGGEYDACARSKPDDIKVCEIYAVQPEDFDDEHRLRVFGHETWHCLGARHE